MEGCHACPLSEHVSLTTWRLTLLGNAVSDGLKAVDNISKFSRNGREIISNTSSGSKR